MIYLPNILTLARIGMVPWLIVLLQEGKFGMSLAVFLIAGVTDALDGYIAKNFDAETQLGAILDPLADKALLVSSYVMLSIMQLIPFWLMVVVVFRDIIIVCGYLIMVLFVGKVEMHPLRISKLNTVLQIVLIVIVLATAAGAAQMALVVPALSYAVLISSLLSGSAYVYIWSVPATRTFAHADSNKHVEDD